MKIGQLIQHQSQEVLSRALNQQVMSMIIESLSQLSNGYLMQHGYRNGYIITVIGMIIS